MGSFPRLQVHGGSGAHWYSVMLGVGVRSLSVLQETELFLVDSEGWDGGHGGVSGNGWDGGGRGDRADGGDGVAGGDEGDGDGDIDNGEGGW